MTPSILAPGAMSWKRLQADVVDPKFKLPDRLSKLDPFAE
jgi:hypothetical protein